MNCDLADLGSTGIVHRTCCVHAVPVQRKHPINIVFVCSGDKHGSSKDLQAQLVPLMQKHSVQAVWSGDDHHLEVHCPYGPQKSRARG